MAKIVLKIERNCRTCDTVFYVIPSCIKKGGGKFCSKKCWRDSVPRKLKRKCQVCKNIFLVKPSRIKDGGGKQCSRKCTSISTRHRLSIDPIQRFFSKISNEQHPDGCWIWEDSLNPGGYGKLKVDGKMVSAHRYSYILHSGLIPDGICVLHKCDRPCCVNPDHLFLGTHQENMDDKIKKGRSNSVKGELGNSILAENQVLDIKRRLKNKESAPNIGRLHGVSKHTIYAIKYGNSWRHVK